MGSQRGMTLVEIILVIAITAILASAFVSVVIPMVNFLFYFPESSRVNNAAAEVLQVIIEGDEVAKGLRFAGIPCAIPSGGSDTITTATGSTLTYHYALSDACGTGGTASHSVDLVYDPESQVVTRSVDGGDAVPIPYYATADSGIKINPPAETDLFRYYDAAGDELGSNFTDAARVDITVNATSGTGQVQHDSGQILLKAGVEIKRYLT